MERNKTRLPLIVLSVSLFTWASEALANGGPPGPAGIDEGIDHVTMLVRPESFPQTLAVFSSDLGFTTTPVLTSPAATMSSLVWFPDLTYVEIASPFEENPLTAPFLDFLDSHEGGKFYAIGTADALAWSSHLTAAGYPNTGPIAAFPLMLESSGQVLSVDPLWQSVFLTAQIAPDDSLFFIENDDAQVQQMFVDHPALAPSPHANTAQSLETVYLVVEDMNAAIAFYEGMGFPVVGRGRHIHHLGGRGPQVIFPGNTLTLLESTGPGVVADFVDARGEGVLGASVRVANLLVAKLVITCNTGASLPLVRHRGRWRFVVPPELTNDFLLEMVQ